MYDLISIGGISVDLFFKSSSLTYKDKRFQLAIGGKYMADVFHVGIGGGGTNVAISAQKNGLKTAVLGTIGANAFKTMIEQKLRDENISHSLCNYVDDYYNVSSILLHKNGERTIIHYMSPRQHLISSTNELEGITRTRIAFLGNLPDVSLGQRIELMKFFKSRGIMTVLNFGVNDCRRPLHQIRPLLEYSDVIILNGHEFSEMVKAPYNDIHFRENIVTWYIPHLSDKLVIVTEGGKGSYAYQGKTIYHEPATAIRQIIDSTGAGDGYTGSFIANYHKTGNIPESMRRASLYAVKILQKIGAN